MANTLGTQTETAVPIPALVDQTNVKAVLGPELGKLAAIEAEFNRMRALLGDHTHEKIKSDYKRAMAELRESPTKLTAESLEQIEASFSAKAEEVGSRRRIIKETMATFTRTTVVPTVLPLLKLAIAEGEKSKERLEVAERDLYKPFGVAWVPSPLHRGLTMRLAEWRQKTEQIERFGQVGYVAPSSLLAGIVDPSDLHEAVKPKKK